MDMYDLLQLINKATVNKFVITTLSKIRLIYS